MAFHPDKRNVLTISRNKTPVKFNYCLHGHLLESVDKAKYLGVAINEDLEWESHINNICGKANKTLGFLRRNLNIGSTSLKNRHTNHQSDHYLRMPVLYGIPNRQRNISSFGDMLQHLKCRSLEDRRREPRLVMMYIISHDKVAVSKGDKLSPSLRNSMQTYALSFISGPTMQDTTEKGIIFPSYHCRLEMRTSD